MSHRLRIAFLGGGPFGLPTLNMLRAEHELVAIITQPDRPSGRGKQVTPTDIAQWAPVHAPQVPIFKPANINDPAEVEAIRRVAGPGLADAWIIISFGQKLSPQLIDGIWAINLHGSLLPRWRGAGPVQAAILAGDRETGNTAITIAQRMDAGLMLGTSRRAIELDTIAGELHDLLAADGPALVRDVLHRHAAGQYAAQLQDETLVTKARKLSKADAWVDFAAEAEHCRRRINGLNPWPGVVANFRGQPLKLVRATTQLDDISNTAMEAVAAHVRAPRPHGQILAGATGLIACGASGKGEGTVLRVLEVQAPGKRVMKWSEFANGAKIAGFPPDSEEFRLIGGQGGLPSPAATQSSALPSEQP